jgi:hypothetical protein
MTAKNNALLENRWDSFIMLILTAWGRIFGLHPCPSCNMIELTKSWAMVLDNDRSTASTRPYQKCGYCPFAQHEEDREGTRVWVDCKESTCTTKLHYPIAEPSGKTSKIDWQALAREALAPCAEIFLSTTVKGRVPCDIAVGMDTLPDSTEELGVVNVLGDVEAINVQMKFGGRLIKIGARKREDRLVIQVFDMPLSAGPPPQIIVIDTGKGLRYTSNVPDLSK